jgi:hypothetical protein
MEIAMRLFNWALIAAAGCMPAFARGEEPTNVDHHKPQQVWIELQDTAGAKPLAIHSAKREKGAYLGVGASPAPAVLRKQLGMSAGMGLVVDIVVPDGPAAKAGLQQYDVLQKLDDQLLINQEQLAVLVRSHKVGDEVKLSLIHEGKPATLAVKLGEHELEPLGEAAAVVEWEMERPVPAELWRQIVPAPGAGGVANSKVLIEHSMSTVSWIDGDRTYTLTTDHNGRKSFAVKDKDGKSIFDGPVNSKEEIDKVPADFQDKLKKLEQTMPVRTMDHLNNKRANPATQPAAPGNAPGAK